MTARRLMGRLRIKGTLLGGGIVWYEWPEWNALWLYTVLH
jgi:hypothetical protein